MLLILLQYYPVSWEYIKQQNKYFTSSEWLSLSRNYNISWTDDKISEYQDNLSWKSLSDNPSLPWSIELIKAYDKKWDWSKLSRNRFLPWEEDLWNEFGYKLSHRNILEPQSLKEFIEEENEWKLRNQGIYLKYPGMNVETFWQIANKEGYPAISKATYFGWTEEILNEFDSEWRNLSNNPSLPWTESLIEKYYNKWEWGGLSLNKYLPWSKSFLDKYSDKFLLLDLAMNSGLAANELYISIDQILNDPKTKDFEPYTYRHESKDSWNRKPFYLWIYLSSCPSIDWSEELLFKYSEKWDWEKISQNKSIPWSKKSISHFEDKLDWSNLSNVLVEMELTDLINDFEEKIDWHHVSSNPKISYNLLKAYAHRWDWDELAFWNDGIIWTEDLINYFMKNYKIIKEKMVPIEYKEEL